MRPTVIVFSLLALLLAGIAAYLVQLYLDRNSQPSIVETTESVPTDVVKILVASRSINPGEILAAADVRWVNWPRKMMEDRYIEESDYRLQTSDRSTQETTPIVRTDENAATNASKATPADVTIIGAVARRRILANEPISPEALIERGDHSVGAAVISPGMRAISIPISETSAAGGFIMPGDYVDIVLTSNIRAAVDSSKSGKARFDFPDGDTLINYSSETVLENVKVLAIDQSLAQNTAEQGPARIGRTATIEVSPNDAGRLLIASQLGSLTLTLRSIVKESQSTEEELLQNPFHFTTDIATSRTLEAITNGMPRGTEIIPTNVQSRNTIRINRGGTIQEQGINP